MNCNGTFHNVWLCFLLLGMFLGLLNLNMKHTKFEYETRKDKKRLTFLYF